MNDESSGYREYIIYWCLSHTHRAVFAEVFVEYYTESNLAIK